MSIKLKHTHEQLLHQKGTYHNLWMQQFEGIL